MMASFAPLEETSRSCSGRAGMVAFGQVFAWSCALCCTGCAELSLTPSNDLAVSHGRGGYSIEKGEIGVRGSVIWDGLSW